MIYSIYGRGSLSAPGYRKLPIWGFILFANNRPANLPPRKTTRKKRLVASWGA